MSSGSKKDVFLTGLIIPTARDTSKGNPLASPSTPKSGSKPDPKTLLSPTSASTFDRRALLSAKAVKTGHDTIIDVDDDKDAENANARSSLLEKVFHVQDRAEVAVKRRKATASDEDDDARKKQKFDIKGGSGVMVDFRKDEEAKVKDARGAKDAAAVASAINIDLTGKTCS